jgi:FMN-dependent oxidoreductase (nitrilotriacetate monooxygenase family)
MPRNESEATPTRSLHLGYRHLASRAYSSRPGARAKHSRIFDPEYVLDLARTAERAKLDFFLLGDSLTADPGGQYAGASAGASLEAFTTAAYLATLTSRIGLIATADSAYYEPFNLARLTASLDYVSHGRAAWNALAGANPRAALNYSLPKADDDTSLFNKADEFVDLVRALWDSWEDDAYLRNKETGEFVDGSKIHIVDHNGKSFRVRGPLNVARPPQGQPLIVHEGAAELSREFAAHHADIVIGSGTTIADSQAYSADIRRRAVGIGRDPRDIFVLPELTPIVGGTLEEARALYEDLNSPLNADILGGHIVFGDPGTLADYIESWFVAGASDGFTVQSPFSEQQLSMFVDLVVPELRRRQLFRTEYQGTTMRDHFGLRRPENRFASPQKVNVA